MGDEICRADGLVLSTVGAGPTVGPSPAITQNRGVCRLDAWTEYELFDERGSARLTQIAQRLGAIARETRSGLLLCFGNYVGFADLGPLRVEVCTGKLDDLAFQGMLAGLVRIAAGLAFACGTPTALPYDRSQPAREDPDYHAFVYLRHILDTGGDDALLPALEAILREPHRRFERETAHVPFGQARHVEPAGLQRIPGSRCLVPVGGSLATTPLASLLTSITTKQPHLPTHVEETRPVLSFDTPENRLVKAFLDEALGVVDRIDAWARRKESSFRGSVGDDCRRMREQLESIRRRALWAEVDPMVHVPVASTVLQRRRGYREVYQHYNCLHLASSALPRDLVKGLLESKDIALLYELWCFYRIAEALRAIWHSPTRIDARIASQEVVIPYELEVQWANSARLLYNATFSRRRSDHHSYSLPLRPDATLILSGGKTHLFDAKLRVESTYVERLTTEDGGEAHLREQEKQERQGTFKSEDLHKMHTYKDAIRGAETVWILYPGDRFAFFDRECGVALTPGELTRGPAGVGAIPLQPGHAGQATTLGEVLRHLIGL